VVSIRIPDGFPLTDSWLAADYGMSLRMIVFIALPHHACTVDALAQDRGTQGMPKAEAMSFGRFLRATSLPRATYVMCDAERAGGREAPAPRGLPELVRPASPGPSLPLRGRARWRVRRAPGSP